MSTNSKQHTAILASGIESAMRLCECEGHITVETTETEQTAALWIEIEDCSDTETFFGTIDDLRSVGFVEVIDCREIDELDVVQLQLVAHPPGETPLKRSETVRETDARSNPNCH